MNGRIKGELNLLKHNRKEYQQKFDEAKKQFIELITKGTPETVLKMEEYCSYTDIKRYASEINIIDAKIRTINFIVNEEE